MIDDTCVVAGEEAARWPDFDSTALGDKCTRSCWRDEASAEVNNNVCPVQPEREMLRVSFSLIDSMDRAHHANPGLVTPMMGRWLGPWTLPARAPPPSQSRRLDPLTRT